MKTSLSLASRPPRLASASAVQRLRKSAEMRSRFSPLATAKMKGLVLDQLEADMPSVSSWSMSFGSTGLGKKSRVLRREAKKADKEAGSIFLYRAISFMISSLEPH